MSALTEDELIQQTRNKVEYNLEQYQSTTQPGLFLAALEAHYMNGVMDNESGDMEASTGHFYTVDRWMVVTNTQGFRSIEAFESPEEAYAAFEKRQEEFNNWNKADEGV